MDGNLSLPHVAVLTLILGVLIGCSTPSSQSETDKPLISREEWNKMHEFVETPPRKGARESKEEKKSDSIRQKCNRYWEQMDSLNAIKVKFFEDEVVKPALKDSDVPDVNNDFLRALTIELKRPWAEARQIPFYQRSLLPVFSFATGQRSVIEHSLYNYKLLQEAGDGLFGMDTLGTFHFPELFEELKSKTDLSFYAFTDTGRIPVELQDFSYFINDCDDWFSFILDKTNLKPDDKVMFLSKFPLELEFRSAEEIDETWENQYRYFCYDCVLQFEPKTVFASLVGVENLYFTYTDTFPINTGFDYPQRALVIRMGDFIVDLWAEEVDLFGCACL